MKAILVNDDRSLSWSDVPNPQIKSEEVLVEIHAAALNRADLLQRAGDYPPPPGCPEWMGLEVAGVITQMGDEAKEKSLYRGIGPGMGENPRMLQKNQAHTFGDNFEMGKGHYRYGSGYCTCG